MEFSFTPTPKNRHWHWDFRDDVQGILEPSRRLSRLYSKHQSLLPKRVDPNNASSVGDIPFEDDEMCDLLTFHQKAQTLRERVFYVHMNMVTTYNTFQDANILTIADLN